MVIWTVFRGLHSAFSYAQVIIYLPLCLDFAGRRAFLALSLILSIYYFINATLRLFLRNTKLAFLPRLLSSLNALVIPTLFLVCLNLYTSPTAYKSLNQSTAWIYIYDVPEIWASALRYNSAVFAILEAISTVLVAQAAGHVSTHFVEERSESWQFVFLLSSATVYVISAWNLIEAYSFAAREPLNATFIGVSITSVIFLSGIAFALRKGSVVEACLIMAYNVLNIYYISSEDYPSLFGSLSHLQSSNPTLPPLILQSFAAVVAFFSQTFGQGIDFIQAAASALPLPVLVSAIYRLLILYCASVVLLAWKRGREDYDQDMRLSEEEPEIRSFTVVLSYSRLILVAVYTHLLLLDQSGHQIFWKWLSVGCTNLLWGLEIILASEDRDEAVVRGLRLDKKND